MKSNYHTHTERCHHAVGSDEDYVISAIKGGYEELGFSDHSCWQYNSNFQSGIRMKVEEFDDYYQSITVLKEKYKDQIRIKIGLECEYFPEYMDWLQSFIREKKLDYIIFGNHFCGSDEHRLYYGRICDNDEMLKQYVDDAIVGLSTGLYSYLAHPDLFMRGRHRFDAYAKQQSKRLCQWCKEHDVVLEYNLEGARCNDEYHVVEYPYPEFWKIAAECGNKVIIGVDAHDNHSLERDDYRNQALTFLNELKLTIIDEIPLKF